MEKIDLQYFYNLLLFFSFLRPVAVTLVFYSRGWVGPQLTIHVGILGDCSRKVKSDEAGGVLK